MRKRQSATFGTISHGTVCDCHLIPAFTDELRRLRGSVPRALYNRVRAYVAGYDPEGEDCDYSAELTNDLILELDIYAPPYGYFGTHEGDGSDYGFWPSSTMDQEFEGLRVSDTSEVPAGFNGEVLHINERGNMTLYWACKDVLTELWSLV